MTKKKLLVVEDDLGLQKQLRWALDAYEVVFAANRDAALGQLRRHQPPVVTMDLGLPPEPDSASEGLLLLQQMLAIAADTKVIVLSGNQDRENVLKAISLGAYDFHQKPLEGDLLRLMVERAQACHGEASERLLAAGYIPYRVAPHSMAALDNGHDSYWRTVARIKAALDPQGLIAPGRYAGR